VVDAAKGDFCWLMGCDDRIEPGGIARVLDHATRHADVAGFLVTVRQYDVAMRERVHVYQKMPFDQDEVLEGEEAFERVFNFLGYLSSNIVSRQLWEEVCATGEPLTQLNAYVHVFIIGRMLQRCPRWGVIAEPCVSWRSGNDSFLSDGWLRRMEIDVVGYRLLAEGLFGANSRITRHLRDEVVSGHVLRHYRGAKAKTATPASLRAANRLLFKTYWRSPAFWRHLVPLMLLPAPAARAARHVVRAVRRTPRN
jgi:abequosyltransferase